MSCSTLALGLILASHHFSTYKYNDFNPGLAGQCGHVEIGAYYNSERHLAEYIAYRGSWWKLGLVHGYRIAKIAPAGAVYKDFGKVELNAIPFVEQYSGKFKNIGVVVNLSIRFNLTK